LLLAAVACGGSKDVVAPPPPPPPAPVATTAAIAAGNSQRGFVRAALAVNPQVLVSDQFGRPFAGLSVTFAISVGGGSVSLATSTTDASGLASTTWTLGQSVAHNQLTATAQGLAPVTFDADADSPYVIEVIYSSEVSASERSAVDAAVARWKRIITTDIGAVQFGAAGGGCGGNAIAPNEVVRGLRLYVKDSTFDAASSTIAQATYCYQNSATKFPVVGFVVWNTNKTAFVQANALGETVAAHELAHTMGFGAGYWTQLGVLAGSGTPDPYFTGAQARSTFASSFGAGYAGNSVPLESSGSAATNESHWRESVFTRELMTGTVNTGTPNPLSAVTIAQFADLGYVVDMSRAEVFTGAFSVPGGIGGRSVQVELGDDVIRLPVKTVHPKR
jgi:hypothetical protein